MRAVRTVLALLVLIPASALVAQKSGSAKTAGSASQARVSVAGIRVIGPGLGANGSELHAFNDQPGTTIALAIVPPEGSGIVEIDDHASRLEALNDDKGRSLLEEGRFGPFPKISEDRSAALVEVEVRARPAPGTSSLTVQGSVAMTMATGTKKTKIPNVRLEASRTMKLGTTTITLKTVTPGDETTVVTFALPRSVMNSIRETRFFDSKGEAIEAHRSSSGYVNESAEIEFGLKTKEKAVTVELEVWQNSRAVKVPFTVTSGLGFVAEGAPAKSEAAPASAPSAPARAAAAGPPVILGPNDGAATIDAAMMQMQSALGAGKGRDILAVIYPDDRGTFSQAMALILTFSVLSNMDDPKAADKAQKEVDALLAKHKIKPPLNRAPADVFKETDMAAFVTDTIAYLKGHIPKGQSAADVMPIPKGKPQNVKIDGDTAAATVDGKAVKFSRLNNKWFLRVSD
jgi:hypothetical protein